MNKIKVTGLVIMLLVVMMIGPVGCGNAATTTTAPTTAVLSEATTCRSFNNQTGPGDKTTVFSKTDLWITCAVKVSDAPSGTMLSSKWIKSGSSSALYEKKFDVKGTGYYSFRYEKKHATFDTGDYIVKLFLNDQEKASVQFKIQ